MKLIIFPNENGIAVMHPTGELPIEDVAAKDVPAGVPYRFIAVEDLPADRTFRNAWQADFTAPDGYGMGSDAYFAAKATEQ